MPRRNQPADLIRSDEDAFDSKDELPISSLAKRRCTDKVSVSQTNEQTQERIMEAVPSENDAVREVAVIAGPSCVNVERRTFTRTNGSEGVGGSLHNARAMNPTTKTAVTVLQEMMVKAGQIPEYEYVTQSGPLHATVFEFRCKALGCEVLASARSKKEAKQEAARRMLLALATRGEQVPPPYGISQGRSPETKKPDLPTVGPNSYVAVLKELCEEYRLPAASYELVGDTGPPHLRQFTVKAWIGQHERLAVASTKKAARQMAAELLYKYFRENLSRLTNDFNEEEAIVRMHERAMERYNEMKEEVAWRPNLGQRVADYHNGLRDQIDAEKRENAKKEIEEREAENCDIVSIVEAAAKALELTMSANILPAEDDQLHLIELGPASPALVFCGVDPRAAAASALRYIKMSI